MGKQKQAGFTIVELLIVVVVIAILAAVTIIGYQGIQQRAVSSVTSNVIDSWDQTIKAAGVEGATMPLNALASEGRGIIWRVMVLRPVHVCLSMGPIRGSLITNRIIAAGQHSQ